MPSSVTLAPGATITSDELSFPVVSFQKLAISMQALPGTIPALSETHSVSREINYFSVTALAAPESGGGFLPFELTAGALFQASWHYINELDVFSMNAAPRVVVSFGDSITDGLQVNPTLENTFVENITNLGLEQRYEDYIQKKVVCHARIFAVQLRQCWYRRQQTDCGPLPAVLRSFRSCPPSNRPRSTCLVRPMPSSASASTISPSMFLRRRSAARRSFRPSKVT